MTVVVSVEFEVVVVIVTSVAVVVTVVLVTPAIVMVKVLLVVVTTAVVVVLELAIVVAIVVRALVCAGLGIDTFVEVLAIEVLIILFDTTVDLLMNSLSVRSNISVDVLVEVNTNIFGVVMTAFEITMSDPLE